MDITKFEAFLELDPSDPQDVEGKLSTIARTYWEMAKARMSITNKKTEVSNRLRTRRDHLYLKLRGQKEPGKDRVMTEKVIEAIINNDTRISQLMEHEKRLTVAEKVLDYRIKAIEIHGQALKTFEEGFNTERRFTR